MAANLSPALPAKANQPVQVNIYEAKTHLSSLVERAAKGEEIVIAKAGMPMARLSRLPVENKATKPLPFGQNLLGIEFLSEDWEKDIPLEWFEDENQEHPRGDGGCSG